MVNPAPWILCDGAYLSAATTTDDQGRTVFPSDRPTLINELSIEWGRDDQWTQPDPTVLTFTMWEPAPGVWLGKVVNQTAIRRGVLVGYDRGGNDAGVRYIFQGFTTNVDVRAARRRTAAGMTDGFLVQVQAGDRSAFLGQINWYAGVLPQENMQERAVRLRNQAAPVGIRQFYFEDRFKTGQVKAVDVKSKSVLDTLNELYKSFADQWAYNPNRNVINRIPTGSQWGTYSLTFGVSTGDNRIRIYPPNWTDPTGKEDPIDTKPYPGGYIGAADVAGDISLSSNMIQDITDIACTWFNAPGNPPGDFTTNVNVKNQTPPARLVFDSWFIDGIFVDPVIEDVRKMVSGDGARPTHPQIVWDTTKTGDIPDWPTFESMTLPAQTIRMVVLAGSPFSAATNYAPVWHPCGGIVRYVAGKWHITMNLSPTSMPLAANHTPVTSATINQSITLGNPNTWHIDKSITPFDLYYVGAGGVYAQN